MPRYSLHDLKICRLQAQPTSADRDIKRHRARLHFCNGSCYDRTSGVVEHCHFFVIVCEGVEQVFSLFSEFLLQVHRATCRLLRSEPVGAKDFKPLPDILKDLGAPKMTLCTNGPDLITQCSDRGNRTYLHTSIDFSSDVQKFANRHYYHPTHSHQHRHQQDTYNDDDNISENNNANHYRHEEVEGVAILRGVRSSGQVGGQPVGNHNINNGFDSAPLARRSDHLIASSVFFDRQQPRQLVMMSDDVNSRRRDTDDAGHCHNHARVRGSSGHSDRKEGHSRGGLTVPLTQNHPGRCAGDIWSRRSASSRDDQASHNDHEFTKDIVLALRSIGDNLDARIKDHSQVSVQAVFGTTKIKFGQLLLLALRQHNLVGVAIGASMKLLLQFNRL